MFYINDFIIFLDIQKIFQSFFTPRKGKKKMDNISVNHILYFVLIYLG